MSNSIIDNLSEIIDEAVAHFESQKIVVHLWSTEQSTAVSTDSIAGATIQKFYIERVNGQYDIVDVESIMSSISLILSQSAALSNEIGDILDANEDQVEGNIMEALDIIHNQVKGFKKSFESKSEKYKKECERDEVTFVKQRQMYEDLVHKSFSVLIDDTLSAVYRGMKNTPNQIYDLVLREINNFLKNVGISTIEVKLGTKIDFDTCIYASDGIAKDTEDINLDDCIYEVVQLPYIFGGELLVSPGKVHAWRFKK